LVKEPERELRRICSHIGEDFSDSMLRYHEGAIAEMPAESLQWHASSVSKPSPAKIGLWRAKLSVADRAIFEKYAGDALSEFGYELELHRDTILSRGRELIYALAGN
jgi:hypothetical protein